MVSMDVGGSLSNLDWYKLHLIFAKKVITYLVTIVEDISILNHMTSIHVFAAKALYILNKSIFT